MQEMSLLENIDHFRLNDGEVGSGVRMSSSLKNRVLTRFADRAENFLSEELGFSIEEVESDITRFFRLLKSNPARSHRHGSTSDRKNLWLHLLVSKLEPDTIVESGVWVGRSLFTLRKASPSSDLHAFDISFENLLFENDSITYHENDWSKSKLEFRNGTGFCYFDDHINNGKRTKEAYEKGFKHLVFDDCPRVSEIGEYRFPGVPTAIMIYKKEMEEGEKVEYSYKDEKIGYTFKKEHVHDSYNLIEKEYYLSSVKGGKKVKHLAYVKIGTN